jgi:hypothetical protein
MRNSGVPPKGVRRYPKGKPATRGNGTHGFNIVTELFRILMSSEAARLFSSSSPGTVTFFPQGFIGPQIQRDDEEGTLTA